MLEFSIYDYKALNELIIHVGENAKENYRLIDISNKNDLWFHLKDVPSPHVVIHCHKYKLLDIETIRYVGELCKENSKYSDNDSIEVIYTEIKNIKKTENIGTVITKNERYIII